MTRKEEAFMIWQMLNLMQQLHALLNRHYFQGHLDLDPKQTEQAWANEWLFPDLERKRPGE
jgi:hypothetical protein